jgi:transcriptional regulator with XRE-family HTH domain
MPANHLGARVRRLREAMGLSLRDLAARSGVSAPMLSQVERGGTSPSLAIAGRIALGLGITLSQLVRLDEAAPVTVVRAGDGPERARDGHRYTLLTPEYAGQRVTCADHRLEPGREIASTSSMHEPGSQEVLIVREGRLRLVVSDIAHDLSAGDAASFESDLPHTVRNPEGDPAVFLSIVTAGLRQSP